MRLKAFWEFHLTSRVMVSWFGIWYDCDFWCFFVSLKAYSVCRVILECLVRYAEKRVTFSLDCCGVQFGNNIYNYCHNVLFHAASISSSSSYYSQWNMYFTLIFHCERSFVFIRTTSLRICCGINVEQLILFFFYFFENSFIRYHKKRPTTDDSSCRRCKSIPRFTLLIIQLLQLITTASYAQVQGKWIHSGQCY